MKKAVVIGAGQTGRGYVTRFLFQRDYAITFIDKNEKLIRMLDEDRAFCIHFYKKDRTPIYVNGFQAFHTYSKEADRAIQDADFIVTSTGEQNLGDVAQQVKAGMHNKQKKTVFLTAENGINPAKVLRTHLQEAGVEGDYTVTQTAVFCSTVSVHDTRLDILSMNEAYFPFDADELEELDFEGAVPIHNFEKFFKRKIYTYNCLAGLISYCGYIKGYEVYGDAACDPDIDAVMMRLMEELNPAGQLASQLFCASMVVIASQLDTFPQAMAAETREEEFISRILDYLNEHFTEELNLDKIAEDMHCSATYVSHGLKKATGMTPINYIIRRRIGLAQTMLISTDLTATQIATMVGYDNTNYFSTLFTKTVGMTPIRYRNMYLEKLRGRRDQS